jgi:hypothetical protein
MKSFACFLFSLTSLAYIFSSCTSFRESSKYGFQSSKYYTSILPKQEKKVYLEVTEDSIKVYPILVVDGQEVVEKPPREILIEDGHFLGKKYNFYNPSFDIDLVTNPMKYRLPVAGMPRQLSSNLNGSIYLGIRNDFFRVRFVQNPLNQTERRIRHFGVGIGGFVGMGSEPINPWVTDYKVASEYEGFVLTTGLAGIGGVNNFTVGLAIGFDYLLDSNRAYWIYQGKPWLGLVLGINLN